MATVARWAAAWLGMGLVACGGGATTSAAHAPQGDSGSGRSAQDPVMTCGPRESYAYISRFQCPDGTSPLGGDIERGRDARRGSLKSPAGAHVLDVYDVPCASGVQAVYVDMYGCAEYEQRLKESEQGSAAGNALKAAFQAGDFSGVLTQCEGTGPASATDERILCMVLVPAALYAQQRKTDAMGAITRYCNSYHVATPNSDARAQYLAMVLSALAMLGANDKLQLSDEQRQALVDTMLKNCQVPAEQLQKAAQQMQSE
jgi:hypothetical protein